MTIRATKQRLIDTLAEPKPSADYHGVMDNSQEREFKSSKGEPGAAVVLRGDRGSQHRDHNR